LTTIAQLLTWCSICIAYIRFRAALKAQNVDLNTLVFKAPFGPFLAYFALCYFFIIVLFNGFAVFTTGNWSIDSFLTAYIGLPIYAVLYLFWKILKRPSFVKASEADIWTGKAAVDAQVWPEQIPRNWIERVWFWIA
jgi:yeast amino acid transporter